MNAQHLSKDCRWFTPYEIIFRASRVMGGIDIDPASEEEANRCVFANKFYTKEDDALSMDTWCDEPSTIWLNPPSGKQGKHSLPRLFWEKLMEHRDRGLVTDAIFLGFSIEQLATLQDCRFSMTDFTVCIPRNRIKFISPNGEKNSPTHANVIVYVDGCLDRTDEFIRQFKDLGKFMKPLDDL